MRNHATAVRRFSRLSRLSHAGALTFALASVLSVTPAWSEEARIWRAAITDPQAKTIRIWDLGEREEVASFKTTSPAQLHPGLNPMGLVSVESASGEVRLLNLGLKQEDHGDHTHWVTGKPSLSASVMQGKGQGQRPSHANTNATQLAVFFDGDGAIRVVSPNRPQSPLQERTTALSQAEAQTIKNMEARNETDRLVNADPDLVGRSVKWVRTDPGK